MCIDDDGNGYWFFTFRFCLLTGDVTRFSVQLCCPDDGTYYSQYEEVDLDAKFKRNNRFVTQNNIFLQFRHCKGNNRYKVEEPMADMKNEWIAVCEKIVICCWDGIIAEPKLFLDNWYATTVLQSLHKPTKINYLYHEALIS